MKKQGEKDELKAKKLLTSLFLGDKNGKPVKLSNGMTVYITGTKNLNNVRAWDSFIGLDGISDNFDRIKVAAEGVRIVKPEQEEAYTKKIKEYSDLKQKLISEFFIKVNNLEKLCKGREFFSRAR